MFELRSGAIQCYNTHIIDFLHLRAHIWSEKKDIERWLLIYIRYFLPPPPSSGRWKVDIYIYIYIIMKYNTLGLYMVQ